MLLLPQILLLLTTTAAIDGTNSADVDEWARTLRIQVYDMFRADRREFDRRRQQAEQALAAWRASEQRPADRSALIQWLQRAAQASRQGSVTPLPELPRFGDDDAAPPSNIPEATRATEAPASAPAGTPADTPISLPPRQPDNPAATNTPRMQISLVELSARLTGFNRGVRALELELSERRTHAVDELSTVIDELAELARRARDISLYRDHLTTAADRENLPTAATLADAVSLLGDRIFAARQAASRSDTPGGNAIRQSELDELDALSRRLAEIAAPAQPLRVQPPAATP